MLAVAVALAVLVPGLVAAMQNAAPAVRARNLAAAERLWAGRSFRNYRLVYEELKCLQQAEVFDERVVKSLAAESCSLPPRSVSELYILIRRDGTAGSRCVAQGCACDDEVLVQAWYDPVLGYPREIEVRVRPRPNFFHRDYWTFFWRHFSLPSCSFPEGNKHIYIRSLEPMAEQR